MSPPEIAIALVAVAVGALVQGSIGFGLALVAVPVISLIEPRVLPTSMLLLAFPLTLSMAVHERRSVRTRDLVQIVPARLVGTAGGGFIVAVVSDGDLSIVIGAAIVLAAVLSLAAPDFDLNTSSRLFAGLLSGVMGTAAAVGGPPLALAYQRHPGDELRATLAASFALGTVFSVVALWFAGRVEMLHWIVTLQLLPGLALGLWLATRLRTRLEGRWLRPSVLIFAALSGVAALMKGIFGA